MDFYDKLIPNGLRNMDSFEDKILDKNKCLLKGQTVKINFRLQLRLNFDVHFVFILKCKLGESKMYVWTHS